jgi:hypothetical protein
VVWRSGEHGVDFRAVCCDVAGPDTVKAGDVIGEFGRGEILVERP